MVKVVDQVLKDRNNASTCSFTSDLARCLTIDITARRVTRIGISFLSKTDVGK